MVNILNKVDCCGCQACGDVCQHQAITFKTDNEGFWYPEVDMQICIDCHLCEKVCPMMSHPISIKRYETPNAYAAYVKNDEIRLDSTSGGIFSALALDIYSEKGYVGGAVYNKDHTVSQFVSPNIDQLKEIRSSKYLQSNSDGIYKEIKNLLQKGETVLYCACPCQIQALYNFLGKDYEGLTTCDFICRGVNSPKVFLYYMEMLERQYGAKATQIKFKAKKWGWHNFSMKVEFDNGTEYCKDRYHDLFFIGYLQSGNFSRPSCYECPFKGIPQKADVTLADFWGIESIEPTMDQDKGTSLVMINSDKGKRLFDRIADKIEYKSVTIGEAIKGNPAMNQSLKAVDDNRDAFFNDLEKYPFEEVANRHFNLPSNIKKSKRLVGNIVAYLRNVGWSLSTWWNFIDLNFIRKNIRKSISMPIIVYRNSILQLEKGSRIEVDSRLQIGIKQVRKSKLETRILLKEGSCIKVDGGFEIFAGSFIRIEPQGQLILHGGFINENVQITVGGIVEIGAGFACGRDVVIRSYDGHQIVNSSSSISEPIKIGNHVWIGQGAKILKGVTIGDGSVIAAGAIVTSDVPARTLVAGIPAKVIRDNVNWK